MHLTYVIVMSRTRFRVNPQISQWIDRYGAYLYRAFESSCSHLNFRFRACFVQGVPWHSNNYSVWIHSETRTWHDENIQSNAPYRKVLRKQLNYLASLAKWLNVRLETKWVWVRVQLQSLNLFYCFRISISNAFCLLKSIPNNKFQSFFFK